MQKISNNIWEYRLKDGAWKYRGINFEFTNKDGVVVSDPEWEYSFYSCFKYIDKKTSSVVFFKELNTDNIEIDFAPKYQSKYTGFEDYLIDDGTVFNIKGSELKYGLNIESPITNNKIPASDNAKGFYGRHL